MGGKPLATNAVAASAVAWRAPDDYSVLTFGKDVVAAKSQDIPKPNEMVVDSVLALRGFGTTDEATPFVTLPEVETEDIGFGIFPDDDVSCT